MKVNLEKIENNKAYLNFEIDAEQFEAAMERSYKKNVKRFAVPGFRRGKAPRKLIEMHYGPEVFYEDAARFLLPEAFQKGVEEFKLEPVDQPTYDIQQIEVGKPFIATAEVVVKPEVKIKEYKGLEVEKIVYNVTDEDIEKELSALQEQNARLVAVENRAAQNGDIAVIDFKGTVDNEPFEGGNGENYPLQLGSGMFVKGFEEQVIGMNVGDTKDIEVTFPEDYKPEKLAGKKAVFNVTLKELKTKELLPLDDDFAKDVSEFETLDELKQDIKKKLEARAKSIEDGSLKASIVNKLKEVTEVEIPEVMVNQEIDRLVLDFALSLRYRGYDFQSYLNATGMTPEKFRESFRDRALENVKISLILEEVGKRENITVTDEELENKIKELAESYKLTVEDYKKNLRPEDIAGIKDSILTEKIFDFLISNSKVIEKSKDDIIETEEADTASDENSSEKTV
ncbi:MAG TPA: trigger factor [Thermoanaerobacterales bacterium]|uniref:trigger factor n=1 Tax=Tepidanaerobacter sp. GT38 TaxID=2722793 RepID=UPI0017CA46AA|nr:trigger factor [Tepidanaerobacter sp. GT38]MCG1011094.1 trigger factor [Tepidanaerobacter sp. GT38]HHY41810.1 trigger factor [Thermoanaerobacterales bacterium]